MNLSDAYEYNIEPTQFGLEEEEWLKQRFGKITSSNYGKLLKGKGSGISMSAGKVARDMVYRIAWQRLIEDNDMSDGLQRLDFSSKATRHGNEHEGAAILEYINTTGRDVQRDPFHFVKFNDFLGGTPDGLVGDDGVIEVKCPANGGNHIEVLITGELYNPEHWYQIQGNLMATGRAWCDFVTYDPDLPEGINIAIVRVERDEETIRNMERVLGEINEKVIAHVKKLKAKLAAEIDKK